MKSYQQTCGTAAALDVLGERWTLLILRDLIPGPRRYRDLMLALDGITTNLLALRLKTLSGAGLIEKTGAQAYALTTRGRAAEPVIMALADFGMQLLTFPPPEGWRVNPRWMALNLTRRWRGNGRIAPLRMDIDDLPFVLSADDRGLKVRDGDESPPDLALTRLQAGRWIMQGISLGEMLEDPPPRAFLVLEAGLAPPYPDRDAPL